MLCCSAYLRGRCSDHTADRQPQSVPDGYLLGNFLVPVVFVAFLYDHQRISGLSSATIATSFCLGGILLVPGASILESLLLPVTMNPTQGLSLSGAWGVGLIEEGCKIGAMAFLARPFWLEP